MFVIEVNGAKTANGSEYKKAKLALQDALTIWKEIPDVRPEVTVRRIDGGRAVHKLPGGEYRKVSVGNGCFLWERVGRRR